MVVMILPRSAAAAVPHIFLRSAHDIRSRGASIDGAVRAGESSAVEWNGGG
jgi:hypothetical protein